MSRPSARRRRARPPLLVLALALALALSAAGCTVEPAQAPTTPSGAGSTSGTPTAGATGSADSSDAATEAPPVGPQPAGTDAWRMTRPARGGQIEGYTTRAGGLPGTDLRLRVSTLARRFRVTAYRIGAYDEGAGARVWRSRPLRGEDQGPARMADESRHTVVAPWRTSVTTSTDAWPPGFYLLMLQTARGRQAQVPYVVTSPSSAGRLALVSPVTTWQAYNDWGGFSLYHGPEGRTRASAVSFDRPYPAPGAGLARFGAVPVVRTAERLGLPLAYLTNVDLETHPSALDGATGYVSLGHDEYWTNRMREDVTAARDAGTNLAFLGANTMYWRVRLEPAGVQRPRVVVGYRDDARRKDPLVTSDPAEATTQFRQRPDPEPESSLTGTRYECFPVDEPYRVVSPRWWGFAGTGVGVGTRFPRLVGIEADRVYPVPATPRPLQVLSDVSYSCLGTPTSAQSVYYTTDSGAGVFTAGTLRWACALTGGCGPAELSRRTRTFVRRVTSTVLRRFAAGPAGVDRPAHDNVARFDLPVRNHVPAS